MSDIFFSLMVVHTDLAFATFDFDICFFLFWVT